MAGMNMAVRADAYKKQEGLHRILRKILIYQKTEKVWKIKFSGE